MQRDERVKIECCPDVYAPAEDTFLLLGALHVGRDQKVLEMGSGTGVITVHCAKVGAWVTAADINEAAVNCTKLNASINNVLVNVVQSDMFSSVKGDFDLIIFNPPYLRGEADQVRDRSWAGGPSGTEELHRFLEQAICHLEGNGRIVIVTSSDMDQNALGKVLRSFAVKELASMRLFFEELQVLELTPTSETGTVRSLF
jgi:release factor glutamine methyltransferase